MKTDRDIERQIRQLRHHAGAETHRRVLSTLTKAMEEYKRQGSAVTTQVHRRTIMKSPMMKITAAAVVAIACLIGALLWKGTGSGVTLADVLEKLDHVMTYTYQMRSTVTSEETPSEWTGTVLVSRERGVKVTVQTVDPNNGDTLVGERYILPQEGSIIYISHDEKTYATVKYEQREIDNYKEEYNDPHTIVRQILACDHISLGQSVIDGVTVEGFRTTDVAYRSGFFWQPEYREEYAKVDVKLWVDVQTFLPVRLEEDLLSDKATRSVESSYDFHWNVVVDDNDFEPAIPADYTSVVGDWTIPRTNEDTMIRGLRLFAELVGHYPVSLDMKAMESVRDELLGLIGYDGPDSLDGLSYDDKTKMMNDITLLSMLGWCYEQTVATDNNPAYYGETVGPGQADKVLLRWRLDDGQYRVFFGDLTTRTVTPEELAEMEKP
ncbi:MAG: hypothetical protein JW993_13820 [Sedimentisphaerales bacterium]|nr:hypothetical protein [Sedimentisphaerales bacterium]